MQKFYTNVVIKRTSCTDLAVLHSYHIFSKDQLWRDSDQAWGSCQTSYVECSTLPPDNCKQKNPATQMCGGWGCIFSFSYIGDSMIPKKKKIMHRKNNSKSTCIRIKRQHASLGGCTERGLTESNWSQPGEFIKNIYISMDKVPLFAPFQSQH